MFLYFLSKQLCHQTIQDWSFHCIIRSCDMFSGSCDELTLENGNMTCSLFSSPLSACFFDCVEGFQRLGPNYRVCQRGRWTQSMPDCRSTTMLEIWDYADHVVCKTMSSLTLTRIIKVFFLMSVIFLLSSSYYRYFMLSTEVKSLEAGPLAGIMIKKAVTPTEASVR